MCDRSPHKLDLIQLDVPHTCVVLLLYCFVLYYIYSPLVLSPVRNLVVGLVFLSMCLSVPYVFNAQPLKTLLISPTTDNKQVLNSEQVHNSDVLRFPSWAEFRKLPNVYITFIVFDMPSTFVNTHVCHCYTTLVLLHVNRYQWKLISKSQCSQIPTSAAVSAITRKWLSQSQGSGPKYHHYLHLLGDLKIFFYVRYLINVE